MCHLNAFVHGIVDTFVWFGYPIVDAVCIFLYDLTTTICRATVNNDILIVFTTLINNTLNGFA